MAPLLPLLNPAHGPFLAQVATPNKHSVPPNLPQPVPPENPTQGGEPGLILSPVVSELKEIGTGSPSLLGTGTSAFRNPLPGP